MREKAMLLVLFIMFPAMMHLPSCHNAESINNLTKSYMINKYPNASLLGCTTAKCRTLEI